MFELLSLVSSLPCHLESQSLSKKRKPEEKIERITKKISADTFNAEQQPSQKTNDKTIVAFYPNGRTCPARQLERIYKILNLGGSSSINYANVFSVDHVIDYINSCSQNTMMHLGKFADGRQQSYGKEFLSDGSAYMGYYENGQRTGLGKITHKDGSTFEGSFVAGKRHGLGTFTHFDGTIFTAIYTNDEPNGFAQYLFPTGATYTCEYKDGKLESINYPDGFKMITRNHPQFNSSNPAKIKNILTKSCL